MLSFDIELNKWGHNPLANPDKLISTFKQNRFNYLNKFSGIDAPIDFCKKIFLPNHLAWFLTDKRFIESVRVVKKTRTPKEFLNNLINATVDLYRVQFAIRHILEQNTFSDICLNDQIMDISVRLLGKAREYEVKRVAYNSQIRDYVEQKLSVYGLSPDNLDIVLTPTFGTIYTFLAEKYIKNNKDIDFIANNYFAGSKRDAEIKLPRWMGFVDLDLIRERYKNLDNVFLKKKELYKDNEELLWIDGLITFDNLIDKLIVYSGILRHDVFLKLALFFNSNLTPEEIFKSSDCSPKGI